MKGALTRTLSPALDRLEQPHDDLDFEQTSTAEKDYMNPLNEFADMKDPEMTFTVEDKSPKESWAVPTVHLALNLVLDLCRGGWKLIKKASLAATEKALRRHLIARLPRRLGAQSRHLLRRLPPVGPFYRLFVVG